MLFVMLGAIVGALARYGVSLILLTTWQAIIFVNVIGTFILAIINFMWQPRWSNNFKKFFATGFCGSFTTLSAFNWQSVQLAKYHLLLGILYMVITITSSLLVIVLAKYVVDTFSKGEHT